MRQWRMLLFVTGMLLAGCSEEASPPDEQEVESTDEVTVSEYPLFNDEKNRLILSHMDVLDGGAVRMSEPVQASASYEVWSNGKLIEEGGGHFQDGEIEIISFSLRESSMEIGKKTLTFVYNDESASSNDIAAEPEKELFRSSTMLVEKEDTLSGDERKPVWGYTATDDDTILIRKPEDVQKAEYGVLVFIQKGEPKE